MKIFIFFGFSSDSILDKVKDTIKNQNSQEKTHKSVNLVNRSIGQSVNLVNRSIGLFYQFFPHFIWKVRIFLYICKRK